MGKALLIILAAVTATAAAQPPPGFVVRRPGALPPSAPTSPAAERCKLERASRAGSATGVHTAARACNELHQGSTAPARARELNCVLDGLAGATTNDATRLVVSACRRLHNPA